MSISPFSTIVATVRVWLANSRTVFGSLKCGVERGDRASEGLEVWDPLADAVSVVADPLAALGGIAFLIRANSEAVFGSGFGVEASASLGAG
jgi:hypothetical protein